MAHADMEGLRQRGISSQMPNLSAAALPGVLMGARDLHELDCSPTQTPAQTRSASPVRGHHMPHTCQQAADFVLKLNDIVETGETGDATNILAGLGKETSEKAVLVGYGTLPAASSFSTRTSSTEIAIKSTMSEASALVSSPVKMERLTKVNAIDGSGSTSTASKVQILLVYFAFNLGLTLYNKAVMIKVSIFLPQLTLDTLLKACQFSFPFLLTALHAAAGIVGTQVLLARGAFTLKHLTSHDTAMLSAFSILYTANIAVSNVSL